MLAVTIVSTALLASADAAPTYSRDIAPIFRRSCEVCHRDGEPAPMSLRTFDEVRPWARSIKKYVESREMPPWHADPEHGKFRNDPRLDADEICKIVAWVDAGAPEGDVKDLPAPQDFVDGWRIGEPDLVFTMPQAYEVPASGEVSYQYILIPTGFTEDKWITALEARPGNPEVVHHIIAFVRQEGLRGGLWGSHLGGMAPGEGPDIYPPGTGKLIKAGATILLQMHYTPNGKATADRSMIGLKFSDRPLRQLHTRAAMNVRIRIPPGDPNYEVRSSYRFGNDATLYGLMPHMHVRGKDFRYELALPGGERKKLLAVPKWDFNWQHYYVFDEPLRIPRGARIECVAHYDNSKDNESNPDPTQTVRWGDQTWDEMMIGFLSFIDGEPPKPGEPEPEAAPESESEPDPDPDEPERASDTE